MPDTRTANTAWGRMLGDWAIPAEIRSAAPALPYFFDPQVFIGAADEAISRNNDTPSDTQAREALPAEGTVLDVACGAGAASLRLHPARVIGVDPSAPLLAAFTEQASRLGIQPAIVEGTWPEAEGHTPAADVVVCHHVFYNVADLAPFASALTGHARHRVVVELTAVHPLAWLGPYWKALHGVDQPERPTAEDAVAVLAELGYDVRAQRWARRYQMTGESDDEGLLRIAHRLCLPADRHGELRRLLTEVPPPTEREVVTVWW